MRIGKRMKAAIDRLKVGNPHVMSIGNRDSQPSCGVCDPVTAEKLIKAKICVKVGLHPWGAYPIYGIAFAECASCGECRYPLTPAEGAPFYGRRLCEPCLKLAMSHVPEEKAST